MIATRPYASLHAGESGGLRPATLLASAASDAGVVLRLIRIEEMSAVGALARAAYEQDYPGQPVEYLAEIADVATRAQSAQVWVAEDVRTGALCGTVTLPEPGRVLSAVAHEGEIDVRLLAVAHDARGRGIGGLLMRHAIEAARERGAARLVLNTSSEMPGAQRLYERMGFERLFDREADLVRDNGSEFRLMAYGFAL